MSNTELQFGVKHAPPRAVQETDTVFAIHVDTNVGRRFSRNGYTDALVVWQSVQEIEASIKRETFTRGLLQPNEHFIRTTVIREKPQAKNQTSQ